MPEFCQPARHERMKRTALEFIWATDVLGVPEDHQTILVYGNCQDCPTTLVLEVAR